MIQLNGRVAIVTGGVQGIGLGVSLSLARAGANVMLAEVVEERIPAAVAKIEAVGAQALGVHTDVTRASSLDHMVRATLERFGADRHLGQQCWHSRQEAHLGTYRSRVRCGARRQSKGNFPLLQASGGGDAQAQHGNDREHRVRRRVSLHHSPRALCRREGRC